VSQLNREEQRRLRGLEERSERKKSLPKKENSTSPFTRSGWEKILK
jgi:hypothetical protein